MTRDKFLKDFKFISHNFSNNISVYWVFEIEKTLGITYFELDRVSDELSFYFSKTLGDSRFVGVSLSEYFFLPCLILGIWKSGKSFAGIGTQYTLKHTLNYLNFLKVGYLITDKDDEDYNGNIISYFYIQQTKFFIWRREVKEKKVSSIGDICYGIMTSGSTGVSKIIQVPWSCILPNVMELSEKFQVNEFDSIFQAAPFTFDPFFVELFLTLLSGCSLMIVSNHFKLNPSSLIKILFQNNNTVVQPSPNQTSPHTENYFILNTQEVKGSPITILQMTPSIFKKWSYDKIKEIILAPTSSLKVLLLGGEKFPPEILKLKSPENKTRIFNIYGITEISCWAFLQEVTHHSLDDKVPLGKPLNGIIYKISNNDELCIGSSTRVCLVDDEKDFSIGNPVFRNSGDLVEINNENLYYLGRSNQIVKKYGIKIDLTQTEELFLSLNNLIKECFCIFDEINTRLGLFYVPKVTNNTQEEYLVIEPQDFVSRGCQYPKELKDIEKPDYLIEIHKPPVNEHGKCDRKKLLQYLKSAYKSQVQGKDVRKNFIKIWGDVLGLEKNDIYTKSFLDLGGNSILGMEIINKLEDVGINARQNFITKLLSGGNFESCFNCLDEVAVDSEMPRKRIKIEEEKFSDVKLVVRWKFDLGKCVDATPTVFTHQGIKKIIIGSHSSRLSCLDLSTGDEIWTITLGDRIESGFTIVADGSRGFVGCYDHFVYCVSVSDGGILWKYQTEDMVKSTPCLSADEQVVYLSSYDKHLYCVSTSEGQLIRKQRLSDGGIYSSGIVSHVLDVFYIATLDGTCIAVDSKTHLLKWKIKLQSPVFASPCLISQDTEIVFAEVLGIVHCFTTSNGSRVWSYKADGNIYSSPISQESSIIIFGCHDSHLYCLQCGESKWKQQLDSSVFARPCVVVSATRRYVCAATTKGFLYLCDFVSGRVETRTKLNGEVFSSPVCLGNRLSVGCRDDFVYSLEISGRDREGEGR